VGTLAAVPLWYLLAQTPLAVYLLLVLVAFVIGIWLCGRTSREIGVDDHSGIVWDEFVGYWITMIALPVDWSWALAGFVLFRLFDILKPWPIGPVDRQLRGGLGIMLDDVLAGIMAAAVLRGVIWLL
jgi:phosphatidylglycerophosphatase A